MDFIFLILDIHMNEKKKTCHDCRGFKWQNINIYPFLKNIFCTLTPFLVRWIVIAPLHNICANLKASKSLGPITNKHVFPFCV